MNTNWLKSSTTRNYLDSPELRSKLAKDINASDTRIVDISHLGDSMVAEDSLEHGDAPAHDNIIADVLHDGRRLPGDQRQQDWRAVQVPEQEQFTWTTTHSFTASQPSPLQVTHSLTSRPDDLIDKSIGRIPDNQANLRPNILANSTLSTIFFDKVVFVF